MSDEPINYYYYLNLIKDEQRVRAFEAAVRQAVQPGDVVVEIGSGLGTYSFFAARAGARKVYAIEKGGIIRTAEQLARLNKFADVVTFLEGDSTDVALPEKADVLILENFSSLLIRRRLVEILQDALSRHVKEGARIIPGKAALFLAPISDESLWRDCLRLEDTGWEPYDLKLDLLRQMMINNPHVRRANPKAIIAPPRQFKEIEIGRPADFLFDEILTFRIDQPAVLHGFLGWFDLRIADGICLTNAPWNAHSTWGQVVYPLAELHPVEKGQDVTFRLSCARATERDDLWWIWQCATPSGVSESCSLRSLPFQVTEFE